MNGIGGNVKVFLRKEPLSSSLASCCGYLRLRDGGMEKPGPHHAVLHWKREDAAEKGLGPKCFPLVNQQRVVTGARLGLTLVTSESELKSLANLNPSGMTCWDLSPCLDHQNTLMILCSSVKAWLIQEPENGMRADRAALGTGPCFQHTHDLEQEEHPGP